MTKTEYKELLERFKERTRFINSATVESIVGETPEEQESRVRMLLLPENYNLFFNYYFGKGTPIPMADSDCAWYHTSIYKDLYHNAYLTLFNLIFRGGAKSTHANMGYPFALKQTNKAKFFLVVGANELRATMLLQDLQVQFQANNRIVKDFGLQKSYGNWSEGLFETQDRCTFMSLGLDQPFRGLRQNGVRLEYASIDDCEDKKKAMNKRLVEEYAEKVTGDIQGAFSTRSERTIINNNYFVEKGLIHTLLEKKGLDIRNIDTKHNQIRKEKYATLYLVNLTDKYFDEISKDNKADWEPSWSERYSKDDCLRKKEQYLHDKEVLSGEFYNTPINVGKRIKKSMIKMVQPKELSEYVVIVGNWDLAYSETGCYKALAVIGVSGIHMTVLDVFCRQTADIEVCMDYHYTHALEIVKSNASALFYFDASVSQEDIFYPAIMRAALKHKAFTVVPIAQKSTTDKFTKIDTTLVSVLVTGILDFSENLLQNPDWEEAKAQMLNFERGTKYPVDFPDALTDAILKAQEYLNPNGDEESNHAPIIGHRILGGY
jgi:hypothetical protein